ncbi:flavin-binding monooxygenase-like family protein [Rhizodiscina lignyota]|uniref:Flavin-binding monooxygenase-like family protein n=1 Tax=Rhizodiscina lignyota TaxID=1504668 RepID=A0A9P4IFT9_9PEZI|nr:flavin-binding monooxygenase-like family protein [Rhizodiscina lignyota]
MFSAAAAEIEAKYNAERDKRLKERPQGEDQFIDLTRSEKFKHLQEDPWIGPDEHTSIPSTIDVTKQIKYLVCGAGYSGLLFVVRLLEAGAKLDEIVMIDPSGGYGGVWYWNRYPGLMCDVESYCYMPLLEETGYMPKYKYCYGPELRGHAERIAEKWNLRPRTIFRQQAKHLQWDADKKEWICTTQFQGDKRDLDLKLHAKYVMLAAGQLTHPKIPVVDGIDKFQGHIFHTSRWDYKYTGGNSQDAKAELTNLQDKRVGIIGTGATAVQAVPELAKWAKKLYVIQRTPSSVDIRNQRETDPEEWKKVTSKKGWWMDRNTNFSNLLHQKLPAPEVNMVNDYWVINNPSYCTAWGYDRPLTPEELPQYIQTLHINDIPRAERIRKRVADTVKDKDTAEKLKHWYPTWCKRPCFHDDFLPAFNQPNVELVDTDGLGVDRFTEKGVVVGGKEYELDLLILSTGYKAPGGLGVSPAGRYNVTVIGKDGLDMDAEFQREVSTLHGLTRKDFPNLFFTGVAQASLTANQIHNMDTYSNHIVYMIMNAQRKANSGDVVIEPEQKAQDEWGDQVAANALGLSGMAGCTPNYLNAEGGLDKMLALGPEVQAKMMRGQIWGRGINGYIAALKEWENEGSMKGLTVSA